MKIYWQKLRNMRLNCGAFCAPRPKEMFLKWAFVQGCILAVMHKALHWLHSVQFSRSVMSDSLWPHGLQNARPPCPSPTPGHAQTHVHRVGDAIQPSHPLSSPSSPAFNLSQHQGLFQWVSSSHQVATVLEFQLYSPWYIVITQKTLVVSSLGISPCLWKVTFNLCWVICFFFLVLRKSAI